MRNLIFKFIIVASILTFVSAASLLADEDSEAVSYYNLAKEKLEELESLAKKDDIGSVRRYMKLSSEYLTEADLYLDKALKITKSKDLVLDIYFLKFLIAKERLASEKEGALFNEIANKAESKEALDRISAEFAKRDLSDYALRLKVLYASKADKKEALLIAGEIKDEADREFDKKRYAQAIKYYKTCLAIYSDPPLADYSFYRSALSLYYSGNYTTAITEFNSFLDTYPESKWFDEGFRSLCKLYYEKVPFEKATGGLGLLIEKYPASKSVDYTELLIGLLYYDTGDYDSALERLNRVLNDYPLSVYIYAASRLIEDIGRIKEGNKPSFSYASKDLYRMWDSYTSIAAEITPAALTVKPNSPVKFKLGALKDVDKFEGYLYDEEDVSRLPKKVSDNVSEDLVSIKWSADAGEFPDEKETLQKTWQAPKKPGTYRVKAHISDIGLVRSPDEGIRKDKDALSISAVVTVEE